MQKVTKEELLQLKPGYRKARIWLWVAYILQIIVGDLTTFFYIHTRDLTPSSWATLTVTSFLRVLTVLTVYLWGYQKPGTKLVRFLFWVALWTLMSILYSPRKLLTHEAGLIWLSFHIINLVTCLLNFFTLLRTNRLIQLMRILHRQRDYNLTQLNAPEAKTAMLEGFPDSRATIKWAYRQGCTLEQLLEVHAPSFCLSELQGNE